jgi:hypothetical protein
MTCIGKVSGGKVTLPAGIDLPDGTEVEIHLDDSGPGMKSFSERFKDFVGMAKDLPADLAENLDHYLHGHPKK